MLKCVHICSVKSEWSLWVEGASLQSSITITRLITHVITQSCYYNYDRHTHKATHLASTSAPLSIRKSATSIFPWRAARCRGVLPFSSSSVRVEGCLWTKTRTTLNKIWKKEEVRGSWIIANALCSHIADTYMYSTMILTVKARVNVSQHRGGTGARGCGITETRQGLQFITCTCWSLLLRMAWCYSAVQEGHMDVLRVRINVCACVMYS